MESREQIGGNANDRHQHSKIILKLICLPFFALYGVPALSRSYDLSGGPGWGTEYPNSTLQMRACIPFCRILVIPESQSQKQAQ